MGALTLAELIELLCAVIGQTGTIAKIIEDLRSRGHKPEDPLPAEHQSMIDSIRLVIGGVASDPSTWLSTRPPNPDAAGA